MLEMIMTGVWFAKRPSYWAHAVSLTKRKFEEDRDTAGLRSAAGDWAASRATTVADALRSIGLLRGEQQPPQLPSSLLEEAHRQAANARVQMGGPGDIGLLYAATVLSGARRAVETGVAYGWSSLAILAGLEGRDDARLASIDMPYPKMNNESWVGVAVPQRLRSNWCLIREPDRNGLNKAISALGGSIDLCHYDSDKSYQGRCFAYPLLWSALRSGGVFISDDIQDNLAFKEFAESSGLPFAITEYQGKYVGILRKT